VPATQFEATVRREGSIPVIELAGDIDRGAETRLGAAYDEATADDRPNLALNFARVAYINSTGIALIVGLLARARKEGRRITAHGLSSHYREIFEITRLSDFMAIVSDETAAIH
jgi:anti-anti-sigma factor